MISNNNAPLDKTLACIPVVTKQRYRRVPTNHAVGIIVDMSVQPTVGTR